MKKRKADLDNKLDAIHKARAKERSKMDQMAHHVLFWQTILIMFVANLFFAVVLIPVLLMVTGWFAGVVIGLLGLLFGLIFNHLIRDISTLETHHHVFAGIFVPAVAVVDVFVITSITNKIAPLLGLVQRSDSFVLSMVFIILFLVPYLLGHLADRK